jgi:hypothetical protein
MGVHRAPIFQRIALRTTTDALLSLGLEMTMNLQAILDTLEMARDALTTKVSARELEQTKAMLNLNIAQMQRDLKNVREVTA